MHILFVHQNFPAQFGHIAGYLAQRMGFRCTFVSRNAKRKVEGVELIPYELKGGATANNHYCSRTFENAIWHTHGVHEALSARPDIRPDLIVGHSGFGSTLFLRDLFDCPIVNYFEYFYRTKNSDMDFRPDFPCRPIDRLRARARNATLLLDLENCDAGYSPTRWQRSRLPEIFHEKVRVIFDGIDTDLWRPCAIQPRRVAGHVIPNNVRIVTYATRGMESMRGFDIFMETAQRISSMRSDVLFIIVGQDRICYGGDEKVIGKKTFKQWVLERGQYDLSKFLFLGCVPPIELARLFSMTDVHFYSTVPFILSWSLMNALACGATVLASATAPVQEIIRHGHNGLLLDFFDVDGFARTVCEVLDAPNDYAHLGQAGIDMVRDRYSLEVCLPQMLRLYEDAMAVGQPEPMLVAA